MNRAEISALLAFWQDCQRRRSQQLAMLSATKDDLASGPERHPFAEIVQSNWVSKSRLDLEHANYMVRYFEEKLGKLPRE